GKAGARPATKSGGKKGGPPRGRAPVAPIKPGLPWGMIAIGIAIAIFAVAVIGYAAYTVNQAGKPPQDRISGVQNFRKTEKLSRNHVKGHVKYPQSPPVGGDHNSLWQNCTGNVYLAQIANEHAVHSMEHGAVWITYRPDLPKNQIAKLSGKVENVPYMMMSPYPGQKSPISLQAWGYQLAVKDASDKRIGEFITGFREKASVEPGSVCSGGTLKTGTDLKTAPG
ncbi:MAG: DUF3105 domain-containing protein, partial [Mycobacteriales bacterium]